MGKVYRPSDGQMQPGDLSDEAHRLIGRLVRACAQIEELITFFIMNLTNLDEATATLVLGKTAPTRRLEMVAYLAETQGGEHFAAYKRLFGPAYREVVLCRNVVAHGSFMGLDDEGRYTFLIDTMEMPEKGQPFKKVISLNEADLSHFTNDAEQLRKMIETDLMLEPLQQRRLQQSLTRHHKASPSASRADPPQSSPG